MSDNSKKPAEPPVRIRYAKIDELEQVWILDHFNLGKNWNLHPATHGPLDKQMLEHIHETRVMDMYDPDRHRILVALSDDTVIGHAWYGISTDPLFCFEVGFLFSLVIRPDFRRRGIARRLVLEFKKRAKKAGADFVRLAVLHQNEGALNLYRQTGFFDEMHYLMARLDLTGPEKAKLGAAKRKNQA